MDNRRKHQRYEAAVAAEIELDGNLLEGETRDISIGGVSVLVAEPLEESMHLAVTLILTEDGIESADDSDFTAAARVMWIAPTGDGACLAGLRFSALGNEELNRLNRFLAALGENRR